MGVEPTQDGITAPHTVLKTGTVTGPRAAPQRYLRMLEPPVSPLRHAHAALDESAIDAVAGAQRGAGDVYLRSCIRTAYQALRI
jgi:hypothetical protein